MKVVRGTVLAGVAVVLVGCGVAAPETSPRGTSWSRHEGMAAMPHVVGVSSGIAVGFRGAGSGLEAVRSTDGLTWTAVAVIDPLDEAGVTAIGARSGEGSDAFVAVGSSTDRSETGRAAAWVSDGTGGWKRAPDGPDLGNASGSGGTAMSAVAWGQGKWVAGGVEFNESSGQDGVVWTSPDGFNWSRVTLPDPGMGIMDLVAGGPGFVAVGTSESVAPDVSHSGIWTSVDGTIWARVPDGPIFANAGINAVVTGGPGLVAVGYTLDRTGVFAPTTWSSVDGQSWAKDSTPTDLTPWTLVEGTLQGRAIGDIVATLEGFVGVGVEFGLNPRNLHRAAVWISADGRSWARVPHDPVFDGGEDSSATFGMRSVYLTGSRLIATGRTPGGPTVWISPPDAGQLPGQTGPGATPGGPVVPLPEPEPGPTQPEGPMLEPPRAAPTAPFEMGAAEFLAQVCPTLAALDLAFGTEAGERGSEADALFDALEARDAEAIHAAIAPVRSHLTSTSEVLGTWIPWAPGDETRALLEPFVRHLLSNLDQIERDVQGGIAPAAGPEAFMDAESWQQFARILEAVGEALRQVPGSPSC